MKKTIFFNLFLISLFFFPSCSDDYEDLNPNNQNDEIVWIADISAKEETITRAPATGSVGSDGLYTFSRVVDRLWYAVYYNNELLFHSEQADSPKTVIKNDGFSVPFKFHKDVDPTKVYIFFWAGCNDDNVTIGNASSSNGITLNFENRSVSVDPKYMNGNNSELQEYDSFAGYTQLSPTQNTADYNVKVTLKRPFAQIHILSEDFTNSKVSSNYPNGITIVPGFGADEVSSSNYTSNLMSPTTWFFDDEINGSYKKNEFRYALTNYEFTNKLSGRSPERVTYNGKQMDYLCCYYVFAPVVKAQLKTAQTDGGKTYNKLNIGIRETGKTLGTSEFFTISLPSDGLQANNRYVVSNQKFIEEEEINLEEIAWGVPLKETEDPNWGRVGNLSLWESYKSQIGRYLMNNQGRAAKLDPEDSGYYSNGSPVDESKGHVVVIAPNLYYYVQPAEGSRNYPILWMSENPISDKKIGGNNNYIVISAYKGAFNGSTLVSRSGYMLYEDCGAYSISEYWNAANKNGSNWGIASWNHVRWMMMLGLSEYGSTYIQSYNNLGTGPGNLGGSGFSIDVALSRTTGDSKPYGNSTIVFSLFEKYSMSFSQIDFFGIENPYDDYSEYIQGIYVGNDYIYIYDDNRLPTNTELQSAPTTSYRKIPKPSSYGGVSKMYIGEYFDPIGVEFNGTVGYTSGSNYWADNQSLMNRGVIQWNSNTQTSLERCGLFYMKSGDSLTTDHRVSGYGYSRDGSARLAYYGSVSFVSPSNL